MLLASAYTGVCTLVYHVFNNLALIVAIVSANANVTPKKSNQKKMRIVSTAGFPVVVIGSIILTNADSIKCPGFNDNPIGKPAAPLGNGSPSTLYCQSQARDNLSQ